MGVHSFEDLRVYQLNAYPNAIGTSKPKDSDNNPKV